METILQKLASSNAHYVPALRISSPPRQRVTFRKQPLHKRGEPQRNSFNFTMLFKEHKEGIKKVWQQI
ncbi:hypothetical protein [Lapidilactobacillus bayanensis]|uniref:hypothetical protein n=1 Tax=Lapidilactobacillus bayanensis TaxID=2485998 RepID=UPI000F7ABB03|nr:hypothetical protein [Lapidilactobacillus bayanensis]